MSALPYVKLFASDFLAAAAFLPRRQRGIYAYLLIMQADQGAITMTLADLADHLAAPEDDVKAVLDIKFDFNVDINGWQNMRMRRERDAAFTAIENKRAGAAKARAAKDTPPHSPPQKGKKKEPEPEPASSLISSLISTVDAKRAAARPVGVSEVEAYAKELGLPPSDGTAFFDGKEGNGWKNGRNPVKDWRATFRNWKQNGWHPSQNHKVNGKPAVPVYKPKPSAPCTLPPDYAEIEARRRAKEQSKP